MKQFKFSKIKNLFFSLIILGTLFSCQRTNGQTYPPGEGAFTVLGGGTTTTTTAAATVDTLYFKATITGSGPVTITNTFTGATGNIAGSWALFVSLDGSYYFPYPGANTGGNAADSAYTLAATALNSVPPVTPSGTVTNVFNWTKVWNIGNKGGITATTNGVPGSGNPFKYYMIRFITTTSSSVVLTGTARYKCQRVSGYQ